MIRLSRKHAVNGLRAIVLFLLAAVTPLATAQPYEQVAVGASHICALGGAGQVECTTTPYATRYLPPDDLPLMREISAGQQHTCGITLDDSVECWGSNSYGQLQVPPFEVPVQSLSAGFNHSCAVDINNQVQCWGLNTNGQLDVPAFVDGFVKVDAGRGATCGIDRNGDIHCWTTNTLFDTDSPVIGPFTNEDAPIPGPFIDLDIDSGRACGLTANGDIECWISRGSLTLQPPVNGPYIDLTVTNFAICGLQTDQLLDCSFATSTAFDLDARSEEYPLEVRFSSIERAKFQFGATPVCGIRSENGTISCFGGATPNSLGGNFSGQLPAPPGVDPMINALTADTITLGLTADIYGPHQIELFWNRVPDVLPEISVEVYRDDQLLTTTRNAFSFYDNDRTVSSEQSRYRVRTVDDAGNLGEFSNSITVDRTSLEVSRIGDGNIVENPRTNGLLRIQGFSVTAFSQLIFNNDAFILNWSIDNPDSIAVAGFEVRIDNEPVDFITNTSFLGEGANLDDCRVYSVAAIADDGTILDYAAAAFGRSAIRCP